MTRAALDAQCAYDQGGQIRFSSGYMLPMETTL